MNAATQDDGSCEYDPEIIEGCTNSQQHLIIMKMRLLMMIHANIHRPVAKLFYMKS